MTFFNNLDRISNPYRINIKSYLEFKLNADRDYVVIWYGRISNGSSRKNALKMIDVIFLDIENSAQKSIAIPIELTTRLTIGTIWKNGETHYKYAFDDALVLIQQKAANLTHSNHYGISQAGGDYEFDLKNYPVKDIMNDTNSLLIINQNRQKVIIHPLTFFMAHYGASKEINRILLTYLWADIEEKLSLNYPDPETSDTILIPDDCVINDAVFLYHLKHSEYTNGLVSGLNAKTLRALINNKSRTAPLKINPYHEQQIDITFKGIELETDVILCTEITGMSMPQGDDISYTFYEHEINQVGANGLEAATRTYKPLFHKIDTNEVVVEANRDAGNSTTAIIRQRIATIGEIRRLVRVENTTIERVIQRQRSQVIPLTQPIPSAYAIGQRRGNDRDIGILKCLMTSKVITLENLSFKKLLKYAQSLKADPEYPQFHNMQIDCYKDGQLYGETVDNLNNRAENIYVLAIYILRLAIDGQVYYIFDCSIATGINTSGVAIKVDNDDHFRRSGVDAVLEQLFSNSGRLSNQDLISEEYGVIIKFKHTKTASSQWVRTVIDRLNQPDIEESV